MKTTSFYISQNCYLLYAFMVYFVDQYWCQRSGIKGAMLTA